MKASVIISTYNQSEWLRKALTGYVYQTNAEFEVIIADDGSTEETAEVVKSFSDKLPVHHVWHPDDGFRKNTILNRAASTARNEYLIFTDGDCIPRPDFVETHFRESEKGYFLSGGAVRLNMEVSTTIDQDDIESERCFDPLWLERNGQPVSRHRLKLTRNPWLAELLNRLKFTRATWNGNNSSCWRSDFEVADGFDERMAWGGEDREFGERLMNAGIKSRLVRYSAVLVHLDHSRPYAKEEMKEANREIRRQTKRSRAVKSAAGLSGRVASPDTYD